jgi:hypothetical protein
LVGHGPLLPGNVVQRQVRLSFNGRRRGERSCRRR